MLLTPINDKGSRAALMNGGTFFRPMSARYKGVLADGDKLLHSDHALYDGPIFDGNVPGDVARVGNDDVVGR